MKKILLSFSIALMVWGAKAQPWTENLPKDKAESELSLEDYQNAFNEYWEPFNLDRGYYKNRKGEKQKARGWKQFKRWEYYWESQVDAETGRFPEHTAYQELKRYMQSNPKSISSDASNWTSLGAHSSDGGYAGIGRINCIAYHPTNNNMYWVGTPSGGLWVTEDNGNSWKVLTDENSVLGVSDIIIPSDYEVSKTIYIATGDRDATDNRSIGVLKSTDAGATWFQTDLAFTVQENVMTNRLLLDPNDDQVILAATTKGIFKTIDGGENWSERISAFIFIDMEYKPGDFSTLYCSTKSGAIYYSHDAGENWERSLQIGERIELAVTPAADSIVYALVASTDNGLYGVYKSEDSGESFDRVFARSTKNLLGWASTGNDAGGQGWYDLALAVSPIDENVVLVGGINTWRSINGGVSFSIVNHWWGDRVQAVHADKHQLSFRPNGDLFECNDGGIYISTNDGSSWKDITNGITNSQMYKLGVSQQLSTEVIMGLQDNGTKQFSENKWWDVLGGDGMECLIDYTDYRTQYGSTYYGEIERTTNWWVSSENITPMGAGSGAWVTPYIIDPNNHNTLYAGYADVWKTTNKGVSWSKISSINEGNNLRSMAIAPSNSDVLYVAGLRNIYKTENGGSSWTRISSGLPSDNITYIAVDQNDSQTLWVTLGGYNTNGVYQSSNGGESWTNISAGLPSIPAQSIVQDKQYTVDNSLYVGTEAGVFHKIGDAEWTLYNNNMPKVRIGELEIYYSDDVSKSRLRAATYGRGLWETPLLVEPLAEFNAFTIESITEANAVASVTISNGKPNIIESGFIYSKKSGAQLGDVYCQYKRTNPLVNDGEYSLTLPNLVNGTYYFVKAYVKSENQISYSQEISFATLCGGAIYELPVVQEFEADSVPVCWDTYDNLGTDMEWVFTNPADISFNSTTSSNGFAVMNSAYYGDGKTQNSDLLTTEYNLTDHSFVNFIFEHNAALNNDATAQLLYSDDNGVNWNVLDEWSDTVGKQGDPSYYVNDISALVGGKPGIVFKWNFAGANSGYWAIDDFLIDELPAVHFNVTDVDENPINDALVVFSEKELVTGFTGEVLYRSVSNTTFDYSVSANGYVAKEGQVTLDNNNAILDIVLAEIPSSNALLSDLMIDSVTIDNFKSSVFDYTVMLAWDATEIPEISATQADEDATVTITQATATSLVGKVKVVAEDGATVKNYTVNFEYAEEPTYTITFNVTNGQSEPVQYATVKLMERVRSTDELGKAIFEGVSAVGDTTFTVSANTYNTYDGTLSIVDADVNVDVKLSLVGVDLEHQINVDLYPNPASDNLFINIPTQNLPAKVSLTDVTGKVVFKKRVSKTDAAIELKSISKGIYLIRVESGDKSFTDKVVIE